MTFSVAPHLDGLASLARRPGVDIRPVLVRVLTDLYVQKNEHSAEEEQHYVEIMLRFVDTADLATRSNVARKLAIYPAAPRAVLNKLARDRIEVAEPVLQSAANLGAADLLSIAAECGGRHAAVIAQRKTGARVSSLADADRPALLTPMHEPVSVRADDFRRPKTAAAAPPRVAPSVVELARRFLAAEAGERRLILEELGQAADGAGARALVDFEAMHKLERSALQRRLDEFTEALQQALSLSPALATRIVRDESGELLVACLRSLAMPPNVLLRVLLFLNPVIGQSIDQVYELGRFYETIAESAAVQLVQGLRIVSQTETEDPPEQRRSSSDIPHERHSAVESARTAYGDGARLPPVRVERGSAADRRYGTS